MLYTLDLKQQKVCRVKLQTTYSHVHMCRYILLSLSA